MAPRPPLSLAESLAAAQDWWREAGVDHAYVDEPAPWLASDEGEATAPIVHVQAAAALKPPTPEAPRIGGDRAGWPADLAAFSAWWLEEASLDDGGTRPRIAPRVQPEAALLLLVPMPEEGDSDTLLGGVHGRLLASFAQAAGVAPEQVSLAAALPRFTPLPDWEALAARGHGDVVLHLLALARPRRVIAFGSGILSLLGHGPTQGPPPVSELAIQGRSVPLLATFAPERLLENARSRAVLWRRWLEWTGSTSE